jgi:hypothetical protein
VGVGLYKPNGVGKENTVPPSGPPAARDFRVAADLALLVKRAHEAGLVELFDEARLDKIRGACVMGPFAQRIHDRLDPFERRKLIARKLVVGDRDAITFLEDLGVLDSAQVLRKDF